MSEVYTDSFEHTFDEKGRITVPSEWRSEAHEKRLHVVKSSSGCLKVYPVSFLSRAMERLAQAPFNDPKRKKLEQFAKNVQAVECDAQGRIMVKPHLRQAAGLGREAVLLGCMNHFEIWDRKSWSAKGGADASFEDVASEVGL
jgi:MraZ protein